MRAHALLRLGDLAHPVKITLPADAVDSMKPCEHRLACAVRCNELRRQAIPWTCGECGPSPLRPAALAMCEISSPTHFLSPLWRSHSWRRSSSGTPAVLCLSFAVGFFELSVLSFLSFAGCPLVVISLSLLGSIKNRLEAVTLRDRDFGSIRPGLEKRRNDCDVLHRLSFEDDAKKIGRWCL